MIRRVLIRHAGGFALMLAFAAGAPAAAQTAVDPRSDESRSASTRPPNGTVVSPPEGAENGHEPTR